MKNPPTRPKEFAIFDGDLDDTWLENYRKASALAIDTEAMGLIHGRDRICLVQICDPSDQVACVRIAIGQKSAPKLKELLESQSIEKVFHFARFDFAAILNGLNIKTSPLFCTKIASKLARTYTPRHGLKDLILELVGIELDKQAQSSDWGNHGGLTDKQLLNGANDTRYLLKAKERLESMLLREGRYELAKRCFKCIPVIAELDILRFTNTFEH